VEVLSQGALVAERLGDWLHRHPEMAARLGHGGRYRVLTTDKPSWFEAFGQRVLGEAFEATEVRLRALR
jgi:glutamate racemase